MGGGGAGKSKYRGTTGDTEIEREGHRERDTKREIGGGGGRERGCGREREIWENRQTDRQTDKLRDRKSKPKLYLHPTPTPGRLIASHTGLISSLRRHSLNGEIVFVLQ